MKTDNRTRRRALLTTAAAPAIALALWAGSAAAQEQAKTFAIAPQPLADALLQFSRQADIDIVASTDLTRGRVAPKVAGEMTTADAMSALLAGSGLVAAPSGTGYVITRAADPQSGSAAGDGADSGTVQALIVTAQKREENIQDVPIAISAFTQEDLTRSQIAGGPDLVTQIPNFTFTKTNFSGYSIQIRGIGTQAISATTDPAVAVAFNNTPFIRNRFFEQEFYDLERVEVLRGPQGTLYGRNATAGVVNIISAKPKFAYEAKLSADVGNFSSSRLEGMINVPLVEEKVALRLAGAWTKRDGYATNQITSNPIDGRDLWSSRLSLRVAPTDKLNVNLIWEHFQEDDDRLRSGKQLCKKDVITTIAGFDVGLKDGGYTPLPESGGNTAALRTPEATLSQGCTRGSLYSPDAFQTPVGMMLPYYLPLGSIGLPTALDDPYVSTVQSPDLRVIESTIDPDYRAKSDIGEIQVSFDLTENLRLSSETAYGADSVYSLQDFNRFNTAPGAWRATGGGADELVARGVLSPDGYFCDPQLGCSNRLVAVDVATARARQFNQEFRLASDFDGPFNFSLGTNFTRADSTDKYYVFINSLSIIAAVGQPNITLTYDYIPGVTDNSACLENGPKPGNPNGIYPVAECVYMDPNPIGSVNDQGHNYFLSKNPYKLISYAVFGEAYYNLAENLKVTAGLRWTVDKKEAPRIPTWILASQSYGYPVAETIRQEWREPTGRLAIDWKPDLSFTDETLIYASAAHGYKAGGANPPGFVRVFRTDPMIAQSSSDQSATRPRTFKPEFVNAFEIGTKNTLLEGKATANLAAFYYDYTGYQISEIVDRSAFNRNFDATVWGVEFEGDWRPVENLRLGLKAGYEKTRIADGEQAIDLMDRTAGDPRWTLVRPFPTYASSCILPTWLLIGRDPYPTSPNPQLVLLGGMSGGNPGGCELAYQMGVDPVSGAQYQPNPDPNLSTFDRVHNGVINYTAWSTNPADYAGFVWPGGVVTDRAYPGWDPATAPNNGEGIMKPLGGNELPNAPHFTATVTGDYTVPLPNEWLLTLHSDLHWQSQSWWRVFNDHVYDKLHPYFTMNLAAIFTNEDAGWNIMAYIKNVTDETAITGAFLNSDDTGLTTNVFLTEPRLYGLRVTKQFTGDNWWTGASADHAGPYPLTVELGGQVMREDAPVQGVSNSLESNFPDALRLGHRSQDFDLDHGDVREVKLTYQPTNSLWKVSAGMRYGRASGVGPHLRAEQTVGDVCGFGAPFAWICDKYGSFDVFKHVKKTDFTDTQARQSEEHRIVDFAVGRDFGLGGADQTVQLGLRHGHFESTQDFAFDGVPDWNIQNGFFLPFPPVPVTHHRDTLSAHVDSKFDGAGPALEWDAALPLLGDKENGRLAIDWSVAGGVLFGKQKTTVEGEQRVRYYSVTGAYVVNGSWNAPIEDDTTALNIPPRSHSVSAPVVDVSLGLSYDIQRIKLSTGYRWERYYNVLDTGFAEHKSDDRTMDGPYFKIAVGFGG